MHACLQKQGSLAYREWRVRSDSEQPRFLILQLIIVLLEQTLFVNPLLATLSDVLPLVLADLAAGRGGGTFSAASYTDLHLFLRDKFLHSRQLLVNATRDLTILLACTRGSLRDVPDNWLQYESFLNNTLYLLRAARCFVVR